ncbi:hypothetical protein NEMIN01_1887 [Nematocida minor]|uniref:uncharacterized protein n=1 Tax=Nematocida minor TaxID=1912983 RepID=UPI00221F1085|nr:uncharacterized protein NEMIN01_1887 [Nematocida minor]KAI5192218.1 hypothetical protein NEMIN01_1887 [Nematocida minor]
MEYILCGIPADTAGMVRYIGMTEDECSVESVCEVSYSLGRYTLLVSNCTNENSGDKQSRNILSIMYPPDKSKNRRSLGRKKSVSEFIGEGVCSVLEEIGCKNKRVREYKKSTYKYKGVDIIVIKKDEKDLVIARSDRIDGEAALEDVRNKLSLWVNLIVPPESVHECML